jgi:cell division septation protein DedD
VPKNEDGEFELVLGNTQLLSVFFIVVALMGVFFAIGYILGRNSSPIPSEIAARKTPAKPLVVDSSSPDGSAASDSASSGSAATPSPATPTPAQEPPATTKPAPKSEPQERTRQEKPKPAPPEKVAKAEQPKPKPPEPSRPAPAAASGELSGTYLQLTATSEHEATVYVDVLRKKGFKAQSAEVPEKHGLFRVLVGPVAEGNVNKTKADLRAAGFPGDQAIKRTF